MPIGRISCTCTIYQNAVYMIGGINSEIVLDDIWKLNTENYVWERITIFEKNPGGIYGHSAALIEHHIFMYIGDSADNTGELLKAPAHGVLWSLNLEGNLEWSRYKVEGDIPPKRFYAAVLITNDIIIYGGGPDSNVYQLDRNDVKSDAMSSDIFQDFILPYTSIVEKHIPIKPKKNLKKLPTKSSSASEPIPDEEEEKMPVFGHQVKRNDTSSSKVSKSSSRRGKAEDVMHQAELIALSRKTRK